MSALVINDGRQEQPTLRQQKYLNSSVMRRKVPAGKTAESMLKFVVTIGPEKGFWFGFRKVARLSKLPCQGWQKFKPGQYVCIERRIDADGGVVCSSIM